MDPSDQLLIDDAIKIVESASEHEIVLRLLGALAVLHHCQENARIYAKLDRLNTGGRRFTDVDYAAYGKQAGSVSRFFEKDLGYKSDPVFAALFGRYRGIWEHPKGLYHVDVFYDQLRFSHDINFGSQPKKGRLELDYPTISLADLLLEKTQIHQINEKDIKDIIAILAIHNLSEGQSSETIDVQYIAQVLSNDWGFYHDVQTNLNKVRTLAQQYAEKDLIDAQTLDAIDERIVLILKRIEDEPKAGQWERRAKKGEQSRWWNEVEEVEREIGQSTSS